VQMTGLAIPSSMPVGGEQKIVEHRLPGGYVMLDVMGPVYSEKHWTGYFDGQAALQTARTVEKMWQSGGQFKLAWNVSNYTVVIKSFNYEDKLIAPIKYDITCMVVADNSATSGETLTSMVLQVTSDLATGNPIAALSAVSQGVVGSSVSSALTAAGATGAATFGSAAYTTAVNAVNTASSARLAFLCPRFLPRRRPASPPARWRSPSPERCPPPVISQTSMSESDSCGVPRPTCKGPAHDHDRNGYRNRLLYACRTISRRSDAVLSDYGAE
jgi:hypothetical protein